MKAPKNDIELARHIIEFDPRDKTTHAYWTEIEPSLLEHPQPIPWPSGTEPQSQPISPSPKSSDPLPAADFLIVTWTVAEAEALADTLSPGYPSNNWYKYDRLFESYKKNIQPGAPALKSNRLGSFFPTRIGNKKVLCFKSELHMSQDGPKLPIRELWKQIIQETKSTVVVTTGTAGGVGSPIKLGDVVVTGTIRFHCDRTFKNAPFNNAEYQNKASAPTSYFDPSVNTLIPINANHLPPAQRYPTIRYDVSQIGESIDVITTDFFAFDNTTDTYRLQGLGAAVEMGDAVLGLACQDLGSQAPNWYAIRNASDPQIDGTLSLEEQRKVAAQTYEKYGYWTTIDSAIATWSVIAAS